MAHVLIVDDDPALHPLLGPLLAERGHRAEGAGSGDAALRLVRRERPDLVLLDLRMEDMDGFDALQRLTQEAPGLPVVMITAYGDVDSAVRAMKLGATDFLQKPFDNRTLLDTIDILLAMRRGASPGLRPAIVGESPRFREAVNLALKFAVPDINVLLTGETGTGKDVLAQMIHSASKRSGGPFVPVDCSVLPGELIESELFGHEKGSFTGAAAQRIGRFETAKGGTLFLDEIGNLPPSLQAKLLRVLQERKIERVGGGEAIRLDVRLVSATNTDLAGAIGRGLFRRDLYYRLNEMTIDLPPLRERPGDVSRMARHFVEVAARTQGKPAPELPPETLAVLEAYPWPGNVRQLQGAMKAAVVLAHRAILAAHLPPAIRGAEAAPAATMAAAAGADGQGHLRVQLQLKFAESGLDLKVIGDEAAAGAERAVLSDLLAKQKYSSARLARVLHVDPKTLRAKLRKYGLGGSGR
ncbi:MAG: sigma-54 dependent transcriptional regulator [Myxococcota bacterium]|nr:sigma-54 dependent transcriptional regulator [Myxococcota bacterium]